jgi:hypothetical protein
LCKALRDDAGPCFRAGHHQAEATISGSPRAQHDEPETDGCVAKFIQTLNERVLGIERFDSLEQIRGYRTRARPASAASDAVA